MDILYVIGFKGFDYIRIEQSKFDIVENKLKIQMIAHNIGSYDFETGGLYHVPQFDIFADKEYAEYLIKRIKESDRLHELSIFSDNVIDDILDKQNSTQCSVDNLKIYEYRLNDVREVDK